MFKKILQSLSKSQTAKAATPPPAAAPVPAPTPAASPSSRLPAKPAGVLDSSARSANATPDELCEIAPKTPKDQVAARLKLLYRRYNHSASSLDAKTRAEAEKMLTAIVQVREKYFGEI